VTVRFFETTLLPRLAEAISDDADEYTLTRTVIGVYVRAVADDPALYRFALTNSPTSSVGTVESERLVAQLLTAAIVLRMEERSADTSGAKVWSHVLVGGIQRAVDWWMTDRDVSVDELIDYLTMMVWSSVIGIAGVDGSREQFISDPPPLTQPTRPEEAHVDG